jgi:uncharacterized protein (TIGR03790 family)
MGFIDFRVGWSLLLLAASLPAETPARVLLVTNLNSPVSVRLSNFYQRWHTLSAQQVCLLRAPTTETIKRKDFETFIVKSIEACLRGNNLVESVHYIVLTQGIPIRIERTTQDDGASVDSELTTLYRRLHGGVVKLDSAIENPFYRQRDRPFRHPDFPIYLVTRLAGYSFEDARNAVVRCREAINRGKVVFDLKADNEDAGNAWMRDAAIFLPEYRVVLDVSPAVVPPQKDVIGYCGWGSNDPARKSRKSGMQWLPGAIATEFVSTNARTLAMPPFQWTLGAWNDSATWFAGSPQSMVLDYVWEGVSGVAGNIDEPYLKWTVRPEFLFPAYLGGRNLAESFYLALPVLSWQTLIIGDPLCKLAPPR